MGANKVERLLEHVQDRFNAFFFIICYNASIIDRKFEVTPFPFELHLRLIHFTVLLLIQENVQNQKSSGLTKNQETLGLSHFFKKTHALYILFRGLFYPTALYGTSNTLGAFKSLDYVNSIQYSLFATIRA